MPLTGIGAAERPHRDVRAGVESKFQSDAKEGMPAIPGAATRASGYSGPRHPWRGARRDEDTLSVFVSIRLALLNPVHFIYKFNARSWFRCRR